MRGVGGECPDWTVLTEKAKLRLPLSTCVVRRKIISERTNTSNTEADGTQQQKTLLGSTPVSQEQESEAAVGTGQKPKLDGWRLDNVARSDPLSGQSLVSSG